LDDDLEGNISMKIVNWNIEWMNHWFSGNRQPVWGSKLGPDDPGELTPEEARKAATRVAAVIHTLAPDLLCLQEGPSSIEEMQLFLDDFLKEDGTARYEPLIGADGGAQKLYVLRRIGGRAVGVEYATDPATRALADVWDADVNGDMFLEAYDFTRLPLVVDVDPAGSEPVRVVVLHTKSKYVHGGRAKFENPVTRQAFIIEALEARRRISAEGFRLRRYLDELVQADQDARIVVTGDFNDGPGQDFFERGYLTHNVTDILLGSTFYPELLFDHALLRRVEPPALFTARFDDYVDGIPDRPLLLDHFVVSPGLRERVTDGGIAHEAFEAEIEAGGLHRTKRPSDHRPVWIELGTPLDA
jgi:endonuclease/exonuclease/phosphatase family metal-dependent hydrolase